MKKTLAVLLALAMLLALAACGQEGEDPAGEPAAQGAFKVGVILIGDEASGYDMAHIQGIIDARDSLGLTEEQIVFKYNIPEAEACYDTAVDLVEQGCSLVIADSFSHQSYIQQAAIEYPECVFVSSNGDSAALSGLDNLKNSFTRIYESRYVSGVVAGMKLRQLLDEGKITEPLLGYVGAYPNPEVVSGYSAFFLGVRSIVPEAVMEITYTNSWYDLTAESEAANSLIARGCVIIGQHANSTGAPAAIQAAHDGGAEVYSVGYNIDMLAVAPTAALTSAQSVWGAVYTPIIKSVMAGEELPVDFAPGYAAGAVCISPLGESCAPGTAEKVEEIWAAIADGSLRVFDTSAFTVSAPADDGSYVTDAGGTVTSAFALDTDGDLSFDSGEAIIDGAFHESELRAAPSFTLRIDGITELMG